MGGKNSIGSLGTHCYFHELEENTVDKKTLFWPIESPDGLSLYIASMRDKVLYFV